jgi:C4-type Zn-finger protein
MARECPLCGDMIRLETREVISQVPGTNQQVRTIVREWVCRECDYFEEAEDLGGAENEDRG